MNSITKREEQFTETLIKDEKYFQLAKEHFTKYFLPDKVRKVLTEYYIEVLIYIVKDSIDKDVENLLEDVAKSLKYHFIGNCLPIIGVADEYDVVAELDVYEDELKKLVDPIINLLSSNEKILVSRRGNLKIVGRASRGP